MINLKIFKHNLYYNQDADLKIISRASEVNITRSQFRPTNSDADYDMYTFPNILKLEISIGKDSFKFSWEKHLAVLKAFKDAIGWFTDTEKKDLFYKSSDGNLYFNNDYNALCTSAYSGKQTHQFLEIRPAIVQRDFTNYEGVVIMLNNTQSFATLTFTELYDVYSVLSQFNFSSELVLFFEMAKGLDGVKISEFKLGG